MKKILIVVLILLTSGVSYYFLNINKISNINYKEAYRAVKEGELVYCKMNKNTEFYFYDFGKTSKYSSVDEEGYKINSLVKEGKNYLWGTRSNNGRVFDYPDSDNNISIKNNLNMNQEQLAEFSYVSKPECFIYSKSKADEVFSIPSDISFKNS